MSQHYEAACHQHMLLLCAKLAQHDETLLLQQRQIQTITDQYDSLQTVATQQDR